MFPALLNFMKTTPGPYQVPEKIISFLDKTLLTFKQTNREEDIYQSINGSKVFYDWLTRILELRN